MEQIIPHFIYAYFVLKLTYDKTFIKKLIAGK